MGCCSDFDDLRSLRKLALTAEEEEEEDGRRSWCVSFSVKLNQIIKLSVNVQTFPLPAFLFGSRSE